jgi:hypothetical protein
MPAGAFPLQEMTSHWKGRWRCTTTRGLSVSDSTYSAGSAFNASWVAGLRTDLQFALQIGAEAFVKLRYLYETGKSYFLLDDLPGLLRRAILERFPDWGP